MIIPFCHSFSWLLKYIYNMDSIEQKAIEDARAICERHKEEWANDPVLSKKQILKRSDLLHVLNGSYIARRFFGKSTCWFSQKLNNHIKNGKPVDFTPEEMEILCNALETIGLELQRLADDMR